MKSLVLPISFPSGARAALLRDAANRDLTTARRVVLLEILWHERYLTRDQLIVRVDGLLRGRSFGRSAWEDTFYRDMRAVKDVFRAAGYKLAYHRSKSRPGYYLVGESPLSDTISTELAGAAAEIDPAQIRIFKAMSPAERAALGASLSDEAREAVAYRIVQQNPSLTLDEARRLAVQRAYAE